MKNQIYIKTKIKEGCNCCIPLLNVMVFFIGGFLIVRNVGELDKSTKSEGFEPFVNKGLHSSSTAMPGTT